MTKALAEECSVRGIGLTFLYERRWGIAATTSGFVISGLSNMLFIVLVYRSVFSVTGVTVEVLIGLTLTLLLSLVSGYWSMQRAGALGLLAIAEFRKSVAQLVQRVPLESVEEVGLSRIVQGINEDIGAIGQAFIQPPAQILAIITLISSYCFLYYLDFYFALFASFFVIAVVIIHVRLTRKTFRYFIAGLASHSRFSTRLNKMIFGIKEMKLLGSLREKTNDELRMHVEGVRYHNTLALRIAHLSDSFAKAMYSVPVLAFIAWSALSGGTLSAETQGFIVIFLFATAPLMSGLYLVGSYYQLKAAYFNLDYLLNDLALGYLSARDRGSDSGAGSFSAGEIHPGFRSINLDGLVYQYRQAGRQAGDIPNQDGIANALSVDGNFVGPISFEIYSPEILFILGKNGSGKSTLAKMLCGLYEPTSGSIKLDGELVTESNIHQYRRLFSPVFQDFVAFGTGQNLCREDDLIQKALEILQLEQHVVLEGDQLLGVEKLSIGYQKRVALLEAISYDRPILILDEWASDQDPDFRSIFYGDVLQWLKQLGKTVVVITHDRHFIDHADRHIVI